MLDASERLGGSDPNIFFLWGLKNASRLKLFSLEDFFLRTSLETFVSCVSGLSHEMLEMTG